MASKRQPVTHIAFTSYGNPLVSSICQVKQCSTTQAECIAAKPWYMYNLRQRSTPGVVEVITSSDDGRWAVGTRKRTMFAINSYGNNKSHQEGRVQIIAELVSSLVPCEYG
jgi:hypothetical protein